MTEREKIVAYLRGHAQQAAAYANSIWPRSFGSDQAKLFELHHRDARIISGLADAIENGLHLTWEPKPTIPYETWKDRPSVG